MIPAVAQTLAEILVEGTSLISTEQIDFSHPSEQQTLKPGLSLYCYDLRESQVRGTLIRQRQGRETNPAPSPNLSDQSKPAYGRLPSTVEDGQPRWFEVSFLVSARNCTPLGEQHLLSEALSLFSHCYWLPEELLAPVLRGHGDLSMTVATVSPTDTVAFWNALGARLRPALHVTVTIPLYLQGASSHNVLMT